MPERTPFLASYVDMIATSSYAVESEASKTCTSAVLSLTVSNPDKRCEPFKVGVYGLADAQTTLDLRMHVDVIAGP